MEMGLQPGLSSISPPSSSVQSAAVMGVYPGLRPLGRRKACHARDISVGIHGMFIKGHDFKQQDQCLQAMGQVDAGHVVDGICVRRVLDVHWYLQVVVWRPIIAGLLLNSLETGNSVVSPGWITVVARRPFVNNVRWQYFRSWAGCTIKVLAKSMMMIPLKSHREQVLTFLICWAIYWTNNISSIQPLAA